MYTFFFFVLQNIDCGYALEPPQKLEKNIENFNLKMNNFTAMEYFCILHERVCVMVSSERMEKPGIEPSTRVFKASSFTIT